MGSHDGCLYAIRENDRRKYLTAGPSEGKVKAEPISQKEFNKTLLGLLKTPPSQKDSQKQPEQGPPDPIIQSK